MKKFALIAATCLVLAFVSAQDLSAQAVDISWNIGVITSKDFKFDPFLWMEGLTYDFYLTRRLSLSPEIFTTVHNLDFRNTILSPAILLNYQGSGFFFGGGATKWWYLGSTVEGALPTDVLCKLNVGLVVRGLKLTVFVVTPFNAFFNTMWVGATLGYYY